MARTGWFVVAMLIGTAVYAAAADPPKPPCNAQTRGKLWPEKTSRGAGVPIEICAPKRWKYAWQQLTIDVSQMRAIAKRKPVIAGLASADKVETHSDTASTGR